MKEFVVYLEGGGDTARTQDELRRGFDALFRGLKNKAAQRAISLRFVCAGGRQQAYDAFIKKYRQAKHNTLPVLLVDSESEPPAEAEAGGEETDGQKADRLKQDAEARKQHVIRRPGDQWDLKRVPAELIHLIGPCLEAMLCADAQALEDFYGKGFHPKQLPKRANLEEEPKTSIYTKIAKATKDTSKGEYSEANNAKIQHASKLLALIDLDKVRQRCPHVDTFVKWLEEKIDET